MTENINPTNANSTNGAPLKGKDPNAGLIKIASVQERVMKRPPSSSPVDFQTKVFLLNDGEGSSQKVDYVGKGFLFNTQKREEEELSGDPSFKRAGSSSDLPHLDKVYEVIRRALDELNNEEPFEDKELDGSTLGQRTRVRSNFLSNDLGKASTEGKVDFVARGVLNPPEEEINIIPASGEFRMEDYLPNGASLWVCSKNFGPRNGNKVKLKRKTSETITSKNSAYKDGKTKTKTTVEPDEERQAELEETFARLKWVLGLTKEDVVRYSLSHQFIEIYDQEGKVLKGKYDLLNLEGVNGLLFYLGCSYVSPKDVQDFVDRVLDPFNQKMRDLVRQESGNLLGEFRDAVEIHEGSISLYQSESEKTQFFVEGATHFGLTKEGTTVLNASGVEAFVNMSGVLLFQKAILDRIEKRQRAIQEEIQEERIEQTRREALTKEKMALERFRQGIRKKSTLEKVYLMMGIHSKLKGKQLASKIALSFEEIALRQEALKEKKGGFSLWKKRDKEPLDLEKVRAVANRLGGKVFHLLLDNSQTFRLEKIEFLENQGYHPALQVEKFGVFEFLLCGPFYEEKVSFERFLGGEEPLIKVVEEGLEDFKVKFSALKKKELNFSDLNVEEAALKLKEFSEKEGGLK